MSKKKKIIIGSVIAVIIIIAAALIALWKTGVIFQPDPYDYDLSEYVKVGKYKGLEYDKVSVSVTNDEITDEIKSRCEKAAKTEAKSTGTVKDGDTVNVSYEGKINGKTFEGGSKDSADITIGETSMIDGFTDGLIGMKVGDTKKLNLKFPKDYSNEDLAGKDVVFSVTVNTKNVTTTPEYDVEFIKANSDYDNKKEYEASVKKDLLAAKTEQAEADVKDALWQKILDASEVKKYPEKELQDEIDAYKAQMQTYADNYGVSFEDFLKQYMNLTEEKFNEQAETYCQTSVKSKMVMYSIARKEKIELDEKEYNDYLQDLLKQAGFTEDTFKESYGKTIKDYAKDNNFEYYFLLEKVIQKVMDYGTEK